MQGVLFLGRTCSIMAVRFSWSGRSAVFKMARNPRIMLQSVQCLKIVVSYSKAIVVVQFTEYSASKIEDG